MNSIAIVGAGVQAIAHATCLEKESWEVNIYNRDDNYSSKAIERGMDIKDISLGIKESLIYLLVSDDVHGLVYEKYIKPFETKNTVIIVAHAYSYYSKIFKPTKEISVGMIAPRMPGSPIIKAKEEGKGVPAFWDVIQGDFDNVKSYIMLIADAIGYSKSYFKNIPWAEECEVDLFIEQYFLPRLIVLIDQTFNYLIEKGFKSETALYELFQSGELGMLLSEASKVGLLETWVQNASPTCRFGLNQEIIKLTNIVNERELMDNVISGIRNGSFIQNLKKDTSREMQYTKLMEAEFIEGKMSKASRQIRNLVDKDK